MQDESVQRDLNEYLQVFKRRKFSFILPSLFLILAGSLFAFLLPSFYKSTATILIEAQEIPYEYVRSSVTSYVEQRIQGITQKVMSRVKLMDIINQFNLYPDKRGKKTTEEIIDMMRDDIELEMLSADVIDSRTGRATSVTIAFTLSYQYKKPDTAQIVCNVLMSLYLEENIKTRERHAREATEFLENEANLLKETISDMQKKIADFKEEHIGQLPELMEMNLEAVLRLEREILDLDNQMRSLQDRKIYLQGQLAIVEPYGKIGDRILSPNERLKLLKMEFSIANANLSHNHPDFIRLKREIQALEKELGKDESLSEKEKHLVNLQGELAILQGKYTSRHPDVIKIKNTIADLEKEIQAQSSEINSIPQKPLDPDNPAYINLQTNIASTEFELNALKKRQDELKMRRDLYQKRIEMTPQVEKEYQDMRMELGNAMQKYSEILNKLMEAKVSMGLEVEQKGERFTVIDPPILPEKPFKPNRLAILLISIVIGLGSGVGYGALAETMDQTIRSEYDLKGTPFQSVLSIIPKIESKEDIRKRRWKWIIITILILISISLTLYFIHRYLIDFELLWLKTLNPIWLKILKHISQIF